MGIKTCRRCCLAVLTIFCCTTAMAVGDANSSRRGGQGPGDPEVIVAPPDGDGSVGVLGNGEVFYPEGYPAPYPEVPYCDGAIGSACEAMYGNGCDGYDQLCACPCWTLRGGAVFLRRSSNRAIPIVAGTPSYSTGDLGFDYEAGPMFTVIRHGIWQSCWDLEMTYFGVDNLGAFATTADLNTVLTTPNINVAGVTPGRTDYNSDLDSAEINLRQPWNDWLTLLVGFRWLNLDETLDTNIGGIATHRVDVDNQLYGVQFGADAYVWSWRDFSVEGYGKAGIFANNADARTTTVGVGGALPVVTATDDDAAFVGELGLTGVYDLSDRWSLRGGYQLLWIDGVALAPEQLNNMNITTGAATVDTNQTAFYHGFNAAAEFRW